jgi:hypothetical protein
MVEAVAVNEAIETGAGYSRDMSGYMRRVVGVVQVLQMVRAYVKMVNKSAARALPGNAIRYALAPHARLDVAHRNSTCKSQLF